jgi:hypothetical protein
LAVSGFRLRARLDFSIPSCSPGQRGITPAFGYSAPHPSAEGTLTPMTHALPSAPYDPVRLPPWPPPIATLRPLPSHTTGLPRLPEPPSRRAVPTTPADQAGARVDCFPTHAAFPHWQEGRHPHCHFRGLLRLYTCYGPPDRSAAQGDLCHEAPALPVTRPSRSSATRSIDNSLVDSSSTSDSRLRGALPTGDISFGTPRPSRRGVSFPQSLVSGVLPATLALRFLTLAVTAAAHHH